MKMGDINTKEKCIKYMELYDKEIDTNSFRLDPQGFLIFNFKDNDVDVMSELDCTSLDARKVLKRLERFLKEENESQK